MRLTRYGKTLKYYALNRDLHLTTSTYGSSQFRGHLAVSIEQVLFQTNNGCSLGAYDSLYDY